MRTSSHATTAAYHRHSYVTETWIATTAKTRPLAQYSKLGLYFIVSVYFGMEMAQVHSKHVHVFVFCLLLSNFLSLQIWWIEAQHKRNARAPPSARLLAPTIPSCVLINYHRFLILRLNFHPVSYYLETIVMRISFIYFVVFFYRQGVVFNFYRKNNLFLVYTD